MTENKQFWGWGFRSGHGFGAWRGQGPPRGFSGFVAGFAPHHGGQGRFFEAGEARLAILSLIGDEPKHGYEIIKDLESRSGGLYRASAGTVYPTLQQLEDEELITGDQREGKKVYRITAAGRRELAREADTVKRIWDRAAHLEDWSKWWNPEAATMMMGPISKLMKATFQAAAQASDDNRRADKVREILDRARRDLEALAAEKPNRRHDE